MTKIRTQAVVFDQGNTLVMDPFSDIMQLKINVFADLFERRGVYREHQQIEGYWTKSNKEVNYPYAGHFTQEELIIQHTLRLLEIPPQTAALLGPELLREYRTGLKHVIQSSPRTQQIKNMLKELKKRGKRLGVFSNDRIVGLAMNLSFMGVTEYFEYLETSEHLGTEKPDLRIFDHIIAHFDLPPNQITYVGDDPARDIEPSKTKGLNAVLFSLENNQWASSWRDYKAKTNHKPDAIITDLSELLDIIE